MKTFKKSGSILCLVLAICFIISVSAFAASSITGYEEDANWSNTNANAPTDYAYSIAVVGDTQSLVVKDLTNGTNYISNIYSWIADNVDEKNIQYVLGVGDITEYHENFNDDFAQNPTWTYADEWDHAKAAITLLDGKVPYSLCRGGGHDTVKNFNDYFANHDYYTENLDGTYAAGDVTSSYSFFEVGGVEYLLFALDWNPSDSILSWAEGIIAQNPTRRVIITTHAYLANDGTLIGSQDSHTSVPADNNGVDIWEKLVSKYDNIQLVISGHCQSQNIVYRQDAREDNSVVTSLLVDPQTFDSQNNGETGMVCMLYFSEDGNNMTVEWYSTVRDQYYKAQNQFTLRLNELPSEDGSVATKYGVIPAKYTDPDSYPFICFVDGEFYDLGAYDLFSYGSGTMERALRKIAEDKEVVIIARKSVDVIDGGNGYLCTNYINAKVTIDLCGYTVNANTVTPANLFASNATQTFGTDFVIKNGTLVLGKGLLSVSTGGGDKVQNFTFENLDIVSYYKELIIFNQYKTAGDVNIDFINCDVVSAQDSTNPLGNVFRAGNSGDTTPMINATTTVTGGSVTLTSFAQSKLVQEYNGSTVRFLPSESGDMTKFIIPSGTEVTDTAYKDENGSSLYLCKNASNDSSDEYVMASLVTEYGTIPYTYSSLVDYPFIAFVGNEVIGSANAFIDESGCLERALRNKNNGDGATLILRRDFALPKIGFLYTNYQKGLFTVDLMGHTVTATEAENLFTSNGTQTFDTELYVKNGTLILSKALLSVSTHANAPGKTQTFTFENLNVSAPWVHLAFHNNSNSAGNVNINYINCNITSDNLASGIFQAGKSSTDTNILTNITVKGGTLKLNEYNQEKAVLEYNGGSVTFLPNENGEYLTVYAKNVTDNALDKEYKTDGASKTLVKFKTEDGYGVYYLRVADKLVVPKASLTMHTNFVYNVYVPYKSFITSITLGDITYTDLGALATKTLSDGNTYYHITKEIGVIEAAESFTLIVNSDVQKQRWTLGVISYSQSLVDGNYTEVEKALAKDILTYVLAAYAFADKEEYSEVKKEIDGIIGKDYAVNPDTSAEAKQSSNGISGAGLVLGDAPAFYFYPELDGNGDPKYSLDAYSFAIGGAKVTTEISEIDGEDVILVYTYAYAITDTVTYTVDGTDIIGEYNLAAYLDYAESAENANLVSLVMALWQYSDAAKAYRAQFVSD